MKLTKRQESILIRMANGATIRGKQDKGWVMSDTNEGVSQRDVNSLRVMGCAVPMVTFAETSYRITKRGLSYVELLSEVK